MNIKAEFDRENCCYVEGALAFVHVTGPDTDAEEQLNTDTPTIIDLGGSGSYSIESWTEVCGGNCDNLAPPSDKCSTTLQADAGQSIAVTITTYIGRACEIRTPSENT